MQRRCRTSASRRHGRSTPGGKPRRLPRMGSALVALSMLLMPWHNAALAFHSGGVGDCEGCHTMHNSQEGAPVGAGALGLANSFLLRGIDQSSVCLNCHSGSAQIETAYKVSTPLSQAALGMPPVQLTPGGDFGWLMKNYSWTASGGTLNTSPGEHHGHNIVALDFGYAADGARPTSPGGFYPSDKLYCTSCHDPHGKYRIISNGVQATSGKPVRESGSYGARPNTVSAVGVFRLLGGAGYRPKSMPMGLAFANEAMYAVAPVDYNRSEAVSNTRVAYGRGVVEWCANCHGDFHDSSHSILEHPVGETLDRDIIDHYNRYRKTGDLSGTRATAFTSLVPFQLGTSTDLAFLQAATASTAGPAEGDRVVCLTCHRAHASAWDNALRWNHKSTYLTVLSGGVAAWPDLGLNPNEAQGRTAAETKRAYYERPATLFAPLQRTLCHKCHDPIPD